MQTLPSLSESTPPPTATVGQLVRVTESHRDPRTGRRITTLTADGVVMGVGSHHLTVCQLEPTVCMRQAPLAALAFDDDDDDDDMQNASSGRRQCRVSLVAGQTVRQRLPCICTIHISTPQPPASDAAPNDDVSPLRDLTEQLWSFGFLALTQLGPMRTATVDVYMTTPNRFYSMPPELRALCLLADDTGGGGGGGGGAGAANQLASVERKTLQRTTVSQLSPEAVGAHLRRHMRAEPGPAAAAALPYAVHKQRLVEQMSLCMQLREERRPWHAVSQRVQTLYNDVSATVGGEVIVTSTDGTPPCPVNSIAWLRRDAHSGGGDDDDKWLARGGYMVRAQTSAKDPSLGAEALLLLLLQQQEPQPLPGTHEEAPETRGTLLVTHKPEQAAHLCRLMEAHGLGHRLCELKQVLAHACPPAPVVVTSITALVRLVDQPAIGRLQWRRAVLLDAGDVEWTPDASKTARNRALLRIHARCKWWLAQQYKQTHLATAAAWLGWLAVAQDMVADGDVGDGEELTVRHWRRPRRADS